MSRRAVWIALVVGLPVSALLLWLATRNVDLDRVRETLADASPWTVAAAVAVMGSVFFLQAVRWRGNRRARPALARALLRACHRRPRLQQRLPGRLGDFLRARWIAVDANVSSGRGLATIVLDRTFDVVALAIFVCVSVPLVVDETWLAADRRRRPDPPRRSRASCGCSRAATRARARETAAAGVSSGWFCGTRSRGSRSRSAAGGSRRLRPSASRRGECGLSQRSSSRARSASSSASWTRCSSPPS